MMLHKKWIILTILSTCLWSENNETNTTEETGIFESISNFFGTNETDTNESNKSNVSTDLNNSNILQTNTVNKSTKKDITTENNETNETGIFDSIGAFFAGDENNESNDSTSKISTDKNNNKSKIDSDMSQFDGAWHLRVLDGMEVRKARAIVDFTFNDKQSKFSGFDSCNRITGTLKATSDTTLSIPAISSTRMACRGKIHRWVSKRVQKTLSENFSIKEGEKDGVKGITIKSPMHELFFKRMQRD